MSVFLGMSLLMVVVVVCLLHVVLALVALTQLACTPASELGMAKWIWALVIVFGHTIGPIAFLVVGRRPVEPPSPLPR